MELTFIEQLLITISPILLAVGTILSTCINISKTFKKFKETATTERDLVINELIESNKKLLLAHYEDKKAIADLLSSLEKIKDTGISDEVALRIEDLERINRELVEINANDKRVINELLEEIDRLKGANNDESTNEEV